MCIRIVILISYGLCYLIDEAKPNLTHTIKRRNMVCLFLLLLVIISLPLILFSFGLCDELEVKEQLFALIQKMLTVSTTTTQTS
jgi:hypothetical protein